MCVISYVFGTVLFEEEHFAPVFRQALGRFESELQKVFDHGVRSRGWPARQTYPPRPCQRFKLTKVSYRCLDFSAAAGALARRALPDAVAQLPLLGVPVRLREHDDAVGLDQPLKSAGLDLVVLDQPPFGRLGLDAVAGGDRRLHGRRSLRAHDGQEPPPAMGDPLQSVDRHGCPGLRIGPRALRSAK